MEGGEESSFVYFKPKAGPCVKVCVTGKGAVYRYTEENNQKSLVAEEQKSEANLSGQVVSLYTQCLALLARFAHCFESLVDFPPDFGEEIFNLAVKSSLTTDCVETCTALKTFGTAYPNLFLPSCSLTDSLVLLNNYELSLPGLFSSTTSLELSNCQLDDSHEFLGQLPTACSNLTNLNLSSNQLTDVGLRRLLLPSTLALQVFDWSGNKLEARSLARFVNVSTLTDLFLSESDLISKPHLETALKKSFRRVACPRVEKIRTVGWASELLDAWKEALKPNEKKQKPPPVSFYGVRKVLQPMENAANVHSNKVMFHRLTKSKNNQQAPSCEKSAICIPNTIKPSKLHLLGEKKRAIVNDLDDNQDSKRRKKDCNSPNQYEQDLLDLYK